MCKTATELAMFMSESSTILQEHFDNLRDNITNQMESAMFTAIHTGPNVFFSGLCDFDDVLWVPKGEDEYQEYLDDVEDYKDFNIEWGVSPYAAAYATRKLLEQAQPSMLFEKFGRNLKNNFEDYGEQSKTITFRRYHVEGKEEEETEISCTDTDGTTHPVALRQIKIQ